ncbi:MAG: putative endonuclease [Enterobacterales bacterium]|jgi:putative endonuclease
MSAWWLYLIRCKNKTLYTGITTDVKRRLSEHQAGSAKSAKYLRGKGPLELVFSTKIGNRSEASIAEWRVKKLSRADKEQLIGGSLLISSLSSAQ